MQIQKNRRSLINRLKTFEDGNSVNKLHHQDFLSSRLTRLHLDIPEAKMVVFSNRSQSMRKTISLLAVDMEAEATNGLQALEATVALMAEEAAETGKKSGSRTMMAT
jgi:hypothetical protein